MTSLYPLLWMLGALSLASAIYKLFRPQIKGWLGEVGVHLCLKMGLDKSSYHIIRDVMLPTDAGTTQIDHIVVSRHGIFVVETKNYAGWIFGTEREATWTQKIYRYTKSFQNPLRQNYHHIKTLEELTGIPEEYFRTVVVFGGGATFKKAVPSGVVYPAEVARYVRSHQEVIIKDEQVPEIVEAIGEWAGTVSRRERARHVASPGSTVRGWNSSFCWGFRSSGGGFLHYILHLFCAGGQA